MVRSFALLLEGLRTLGFQGFSGLGGRVSSPTTIQGMEWYLGNYHVAYLDLL